MTHKISSCCRVTDQKRTRKYSTLLRTIAQTAKHSKQGVKEKCPNGTCTFSKRLIRLGWIDQGRFIDQSNFPLILSLSIHVLREPIFTLASCYTMRRSWVPRRLLQARLPTKRTRRKEGRGHGGVLCNRRTYTSQERREESHHSSDEQ